MVPKIETQRNELQNLVGQNWFTNFRITKSRLTKIIHKIETHKNGSQDWDSQKWFTKLRLTKMVHKIETHKNDSLYKV